jgi:hypothetical protein
MEYGLYQNYRNICRWNTIKRNIKIYGIRKNIMHVVCAGDSRRMHHTINSVWVTTAAIKNERIKNGINFSNWN